MERCIPVTPKVYAPKRRYTGCGILDIDADVVKTWFRVETSMYTRTAQQVQMQHMCMEIDIVRKGTEAPVATYKAFSTDLQGNVSFYWDDMFLKQPVGYYIGDVRLNGKYCFSVKFRIRKCEAVITECIHEREPGCGPGAQVIGGNNECALVACIPADYIEGSTPEVDLCDIAEPGCADDECDAIGQTGVGDE